MKGGTQKGGNEQLFIPGVMVKQTGYIVVFSSLFNLGMSKGLNNPPLSVPPGLLPEGVENLRGSRALFYLCFKEK